MQEKTQFVKQQKLLNKSENLQGRRRIPKHMLEPKSTDYIQTLETSGFRGVCFSYWIRLALEFQTQQKPT